jgi:predicted amidohydrolase YtcJ
VLLRQARLVPVGSASPAPTRPVDLRISGGVVTEVGPALDRGGDGPGLDAAGRWVVPGLWDAHVHFTQWAQARLRLDVSGAASAREVVERVRAYVDDHDQQPGADPRTLVVGAGFRSGAWDRQPTVAELDAVCREHPVVLVSGDVHNGWLSSAALRRFGLADREDVLTENDWFAIVDRLSAQSDAQAGLDAAYRRCARDAAALGVVGLVDMESGGGHLAWPARVAGGVDQLRVRTAVYPDGLEAVIVAGLRTGVVLDPSGLVTMGPLKIISDGSLNTRTAFCCEPYAGSLQAHGVENVSSAELVRLLGRARDHGLQVALHAIGDAAVGAAADAFAATGARGSIEHAQLVRFADLDRMAHLGVTASVQPGHLLDDRAATQRHWPDRVDRCFVFASMLRAGVWLALGSDAPVSPLDPWLAMAAAVHRTPADGVPWNPAEAITAAQALAASTDGRTTVTIGSPADLVLLDRDPLADPARLASTPVAATLVGGRPTHLAADLEPTG